MCKKQSSVSHSSTESEIISLDAGSRMKVLPALDLWDIVIEVLRSDPKCQKKRKVDQLSDVHHVPESQLYNFLKTTRS